MLKKNVYMSKIHTLKISNFRWIENFEQIFKSNFICLIWRWDSWKTTILDAISCVLSPNWNLTFYDSDFFNCDISKSIEIEASLYEIPEKLLQDSKFWLHIKWLNTSTGLIEEEIQDEQIPILTIKLIVTSDLEPKWYVINGRQEEPIEIKANDRAIFNVFLVSDYVERHFSWNSGTPLYSLLKEEWGDAHKTSIVLESLRTAKENIDAESFSHFDNVIEKVKISASKLWLNISDFSTTIDFKDIVVKESKVSLHENDIPFRLKGKWTKRLLSIAIQNELVKAGWIVLIDEIEQWLEPDRVQHLVSTLKTENLGQIFITTHSSEVLVELSYRDLYLKKNNTNLTTFNETLQWCLRKSPEAFFAKKIIICEWATEIWICRSFNNFRIWQWKDNMAFLGIKLVDGTWSWLEAYCNGLIESGYKVCLFCDSDDITWINTKKVWFRSKGINIIDWSEWKSLEEDIFNNIPYNIADDLFNLAIDLRLLDHGDKAREEIERSFRDSINSWLSIDLPEKLEESNFNGEVSTILWKKAKDKEWFKTIFKWEKLWDILFSNIGTLDTWNIIKTNFEELSNWIEND